jgi:cystathionine gamma-synthase/methionine-gamma-lyase
MFKVIDRLRLCLPCTSLGDVQTLVMYPLIASHRDLAPKQRERIGIRDNLLRLSVGIEAAGDIIADLQQALGG